MIKVQLLLLFAKRVTCWYSLKVKISVTVFRKSVSPLRSIVHFLVTIKVFMLK